MKIMKFVEFYERIMKTMKTQEFHFRTKKKKYDDNQ